MGLRTLQVSGSYCSRGASSSSSEMPRVSALRRERVVNTNLPVNE